MIDSVLLDLLVKDVYTNWAVGANDWRYAECLGCKATIYKKHPTDLEEFKHKPDCEMLVIWRTFKKGQVGR